MQRFGSAANVNTYLQSPVLEGVLRCRTDGVPDFVAVNLPIEDGLLGLLQTAAARLMNWLTHGGALIEEMRQTRLAGPDAAGDEVRQHAAAAAGSGRQGQDSSAPTAPHQLDTAARARQ